MAYGRLDWKSEFTREAGRDRCWDAWETVEYTDRRSLALEEMRRMGDNFPGGSAAAVVFVDEVPISGAGGEVAIVLVFCGVKEGYAKQVSIKAIDMN